MKLFEKDGVTFEVNSVLEEARLKKAGYKEVKAEAKEVKKEAPKSKDETPEKEVDKKGGK